MKKFLLILNILLIAAVAFLYYQVFAAKQPVGKSTPAIAAASSTGSTGSTIAYVELDSLYENIKYIKTKRQELESEQKAIENEWQNGMRGLEAKRDNFMKKGNNVTPQEVEQVQGELMQGQQQIESKKQSSAAKLSDKSYRFMDDVQAKMKNFLKTYNQQKGYTYILTSGTGLDYMIYRDSTLNITPDVIEGMNELFGKEK